jgi:hypothetical protein
MYSTAFMGLMGGRGRANAVVFDGSTYLRKASDFTGAADSKLILLSFWFRKTTTDTCVIYEGESGFRIDLDTNRRVNFSAPNAAGSNILIASTTDTAQFSLNAWTHIAVSIDLSDTAKRHVYINGSAPTMTWTTYTNDTMNLTCSTHTVGAGANLAEKYTGALSEVYVNFGAYLDLSNSTNLEKFRTAAGKPANLGGNGGAPTGSAPILYLANGASSFGDNLGTGGNLTTTGTLTNSTTSPSD